MPFWLIVSGKRRLKYEMVICSLDCDRNDSFFLPCIPWRFCSCYLLPCVGNHRNGILANEWRTRKSICIVFFPPFFRQSRNCLNKTHNGHIIGSIGTAWTPRDTRDGHAKSLAINHLIYPRSQAVKATAFEVVIRVSESHRGCLDSAIQSIYMNSHM